MVWTGPAYSSDWITVVKPDARVQDYASYGDARSGSPMSLQAANEPGAYEIRYVLNSRRIVARRAIQVTPAATPP